ncbi:uroporphyrinogen-III synthase [Jatrophihabitans sp. GAS493]|uniref:uroporphyrinogen-III synthase n=1 Tax=Jatrophihabitans sp. GAS493 TaxID=1907575 RepID=UPI000BBFFC05|nr:uroporphyrinogen-III synthase [Jatrophihabitans sp. GAS493]SOD70987.1 uroporphyrinogen-III synthase [Jatrophihabitans sp. GAS493]
MTSPLAQIAPVPPLAGYTVAVTASRRRREFGAALERQGAAVVYAPAVRIIPLSDDALLREATLHCLARGVDIVVATTGIGLRGWIEAAEGWGIGEQLLDTIGRAELIARGPKVRGAVRVAGLTEAWAPESESTIEVLSHLGQRSLHGKKIAVQLHGEPLAWFLDALRSQGAEVIEVPVYRSVLPEDRAPLTRLIGTIAARGVDAVAFTSAAATANLLKVAQTMQFSEVITALSTDVLAACVGPVTAAPLTAHGITVAQPERFRLGALVKTIVDELPKWRGRSIVSADRAIEIRGQAVVVDGKLLPVGGTGIALLRRLADEPGRVVPREELLNALPGGGTDPHAVEVAIGRLRASLNDPRIVETVVKRGYRLCS